MTQAAARHPDYREPRRGEVVRVRSREQILATLDPDGSLEKLPFMPEMLDFCGKELTVAARADKTCDTILRTGDRRMNNTIFLADSRCSGAAHGGCEAGCNLFWREEWLEWADRPGEPIAPVPNPGRHAAAVTQETMAEATHEPGDETTYRCQATEHLRASAPMAKFGPGQYVKAIRNGNITAKALVTGVSIFAFNRYQRVSGNVLPPFLRIRGGLRFPYIEPTGPGERIKPLGLQPGDWVEVKSKDEIFATLDGEHKNRGLLFDVEMLPFCGRKARVLRSVRRMINEGDGKMITVADCVVLDDVVCLGIYHRFCQRAITPYWREIWLRRIDDPTAAGAATPTAATAGADHASEG